MSRAVVQRPTARRAPCARRRLRRPVLAAHRPPGPRGSRLLRARYRTDHAGRTSRRRDPLALVLSGGPASVYADGAPRIPGRARARRPHARHLLRHAAPGPSWAARSTARPSRVRPDGARAERESALFTGLPTSSPLDEPPRLGRPLRRGPASSPRPRRADRGVRGPRAAALRRPVPPGGRAHAARAGGPQELPLPRRRRAARLDGRSRDRGGDGAHPRPGRRRAACSAPSPAASTRRWPRCCAQGGRRPAHLRLRRPRAAPQGRAEQVVETFGATSTSRSRTGRARALPRAARGGDRPRGEAALDRRGVHPRLRGGGAHGSARSASSSRGRSTRM